MDNYLDSRTPKEKEEDDKIEAKVTTSEQGSRTFTEISGKYDQDTLKFIKKYKKTFDSLAKQ